MKDAGDHQDCFFHYIPYSEEDKKLGMVCTTAGNIFVPPRTVYPPNKKSHPVAFRDVAEGRTLPEFQFVYISDGEGAFSAEGRTYEVKAGSMLLLIPGMKHSYRPRYETGWHEYWVGFTGSFFKGLVREGILSRERIFFEIGLRDYVLSIFAQIFDEVRSQEPLHQVKACSRVFLLLAEILTNERRKEHPKYSEEQQMVERIKFYMEENIDKKINMAGMARELGLNASRLSSIFKTYTSMTPYHYYIQIKINKACRLLEQTDLSIKEAAFKLGFDDQYYFSRLFKQKTSIPPSRWKRFIYQ
jgi:AraC-like DNA-binding protein